MKSLFVAIAVLLVACLVTDAVQIHQGKSNLRGEEIDEYNARCGDPCLNNTGCAGAILQGCGVCREGVCVPQCGASCNYDSECGSAPSAASKVSSPTQNNHSCYICYFNQCGSPSCGQSCSDDSACAENPWCNRCVDGGCSPQATPKPAVPVTPAPTTPVPTPAKNATLAFGALYCGPDNCGTSNYYSLGFSIQGAETIAKESCGSGTDCDLINVYSQPQQCMALVLNSDYNHYYYTAASDRGVALTESIKKCRKAGHSTCFNLINTCARLPPYGARWGAVACRLGSNNRPTCGGSHEPVMLTNNGTGFIDRPTAQTAVMEECKRKHGSCVLQSVFYDCAATAASPGGATDTVLSHKLSTAITEALAGCNFLDRGNNNCQLRTQGCINPYSLGGSLPPADEADDVDDFTRGATSVSSL